MNLRKWFQGIIQCNFTNKTEINKSNYNKVDNDEIDMSLYDTITFGSKDKYICEECGNELDGSFGDRRAELYLHTSAKGDYMVKVCNSCYEYHSRQ